MSANHTELEQDFAVRWSRLWQGREGEASPGFDARALKTVQHHLALRKMTTASRQLGFMGVPLDYYLIEVASAARVPLNELLEPLTRTAGNIWVALAGFINAPREEVKLMVRAMFAQSLASAATVARYRRPSGENRPTSFFQVGADPSAYAAFLDDAERAYSPAQHQALADLLHTVKER